VLIPLAPLLVLGDSGSDELLGAAEIRTPAFRRSARARVIVRPLAATSVPAGWGPGACFHAIAQARVVGLTVPDRRALAYAARGVRRTASRCCVSSLATPRSTPCSLPLRRVLLGRPRPSAKRRGRQSSEGALQTLTPRSANHPSVGDCRIPIANRKRVADGLGRHALIVRRRRLRQAGRNTRSRNEPESGGMAQELVSSGWATWLSAPARRSISSRLVMKPS